MIHKLRQRTYSKIFLLVSTADLTARETYKLAALFVQLETALTQVERLYMEICGICLHYPKQGEK